MKVENDSYYMKVEIQVQGIAWDKQHCIMPHVKGMKMLVKSYLVASLG